MTNELIEKIKAAKTKEEAEALLQTDVDGKTELSAHTDEHTGRTSWRMVSARRLIFW